MLSVKITDLKKFTACLFSQDSFDRFLLLRAEFNTFSRFNIDGEINEGYFEDNEDNEKKEAEKYISWQYIRPAAFEIIKGKHLPVSFEIILLTSRNVTDFCIDKSGFTEKVSSLSVNISYKNSALHLTTGIAYTDFVLDKSLEKYWDKTVRDFLDKKEIAYSE